MGPDQLLPLPPGFVSTAAYVESLLRFTTSSWLLQTLCGGVHILDFYTRSPDLYAAILPQSWRDWFAHRDIGDILDLLMREDLGQFDLEHAPDARQWRGGPAPPDGLVAYIQDVRKHLLAREVPPPSSGVALQPAALPRHIALGMKVKKVHEVHHFARYVDRLTKDIAASKKTPISHLVDFGSGQNYLGRALAAPPYSKHIVAVESKQHNIQGAKNMDLLAKLVPKPLVMRNKKEYRALTGTGKKTKKKGSTDGSSPFMPKTECPDGECAPQNTTAALSSARAINGRIAPTTGKATMTTDLQVYSQGHGSVQYVQHVIKDGDLTPVIDQVLDSSGLKNEVVDSASEVVGVNPHVVAKPKDVNAMVISLHSCGNLVHHGLRSMLLNPHISAVAMVGCCYNLVTERLGPPTYKLPTLRPNHPRLEATSKAFDPHGFPMSEKLANYPLPHPRLRPLNGGDDGDASSEEEPKGVRLNITARMMAVQAPFNWGAADSEVFFTRHFYRVLLQRILLDRGVVSAPVEGDKAVSAKGHTSRVNWTRPNDGGGPGLSSDGTQTRLTIGTLGKFAYGDFVSYVRAAVGKLTTSRKGFCDEVDAKFIKQKMEGLTDGEIQEYERRFAEKKKELSVMWGLMAFSAGVVEAVIVTDRWLWLKEQSEVDEAWVEAVFEYKHSPRNLVVVGIKK
ncbi:hypothetical protein ACEQ8H_004690 [Pleosporales sp. CAS-2024a]